MRNFKRLLLAMLLSLPALPLIAQEKTVTGVVTAGDTKAPLQGVSINNRNTNKSTATDASGHFSISAERGHVLEFTFVGYSPSTLSVGNNNVYSLQLETSASQLGEVVISQGIRRSSRSLGYSSQKVDGDALALTNRENFLGSLQGRVAGMTITPTSGAPGSSAQVILRGPVSFDGNNQPLIVVDGLPISNKTVSQGSLISDRPNRDNDYSNRAMDLNPQDIENVTILTGPEAAALYGTDGASGVILITTKRAKAGSNRITYGTSLTVTAKPEMPEIQTIYDQGNNGVSDNTIRTYFGPKFETGTTLFDNRNAFFQTAFSQKHDLSFEGGSEKLAYRFSPSFSRYNGTIPNTRLDRTSLRLSANSQLSGTLTLDASFTYINTSNKKGSKGANSYFLSLLTWPSDDDVTKYTTGDGSRRKIAGGTVAENDNPFWDVNKNPNTDKTDRFLGNFSLTYSPLKWISITGRLGADIYTTQGNRLYHPQSNSGIGTGGLLETYIDNTKVYNGSLVVNIKKSFGDFSNNVSIGANFDDNRSDISSERGEKFLIPDYNSINNTDVSTQRSFLSILSMKKFGYFGNWNLGYRNIVYLSLTGRLDASSNLVPNDPYFFYPGAGLSFIFTELTKGSIPWLSFGKLKANIAATGKDPRKPYLTKDRLDPQRYTGGGLALNVTLGNSTLKAEFTNTYEFGTEMRFFGDRLNLDFTYYNIRTRDQITAPRLSYATGGVLSYINSGEVENKGVQLQVSGIPVRTNNFQWRTIVNFSRNTGTVIETPAGLPTFYLSDTWLYAGVRAEFVKGASISSISSNGYLKNADGDVIISPTTGLPVRDGNFYVRGDRAPDFTMGFVNEFNYKNWSLSFVMDMRRGGVIFNGNDLYLLVTGLSPRTFDREQPRVIEGVLQDGLENTKNPTRNTIAVVPYYANGYYTAQYSEEDFIEKDINWLRMQDISLSYSFTGKLVGSSRFMKSLRMGVSAANLFLLTNYRGVDPSVSGLNASAGGYGGTGFDYAVLPSARTFTFKLDIGL
jgi:TonB-linked SusC/RagA family outer membrane protein